jgi:hypothetical protein
MDFAGSNSSIRPPVPKQKKKYQSWLATDIVLSGKKGGHTPAQMSILTGVVSPMTAQALAARGVNVTTKALPGPLQ